jgi:hypothetical protein
VRVGINERNNMKKQHIYSFLPRRYIGDVTTATSCSVIPKISVSWELIICQKGKPDISIGDLKRGAVLVYLACLGSLRYGYSLRECLDAAEEIIQEVTSPAVPGFVYKGVRLDMFFQTDGVYTIELEPGQGTTVAVMRYDTGDGAYETIMGLLTALRTGYLVGRHSQDTK